MCHQNPENVQSVCAKFSDTCCGSTLAVEKAQNAAALQLKDRAEADLSENAAACESLNAEKVIMSASYFAIKSGLTRLNSVETIVNPLCFCPG